MDRTNKSLFLLVSVITCLLLSCDQDRVYEKNIKIFILHSHYFTSGYFSNFWIQRVSIASSAN